MRRIICRCPKLDHRGKSIPLTALYVDTALFSTLHKVNWARLLGHLIRHSEIYSELVQWNVKEKSRIHSPSEACMGDMGIMIEQALVYAGDRKYWQTQVENLQASLGRKKTYVSYRGKGWHKVTSTALRDTNLSDLQYAEEGTTPFVIDEGALHIYSDASVSSVIGKMGLGMVEVHCGKEVSSFAICKETLGCGSPERAELYAALTAIQRAPQDRERIILHTDSWVVWHFANVIRKKYYLIGFEGLPNSDIYLDLEHAFRGLEARSVQLFVFKVKGHCGNIYNEKCDLIAKAALSRNSSKKNLRAFDVFDFVPQLIITREGRSDMMSLRRNFAISPAREAVLYANKATTA